MDLSVTKDGIVLLAFKWYSNEVEENSFSRALIAASLLVDSHKTKQE